MVEIKYTGDELWARIERAVDKVKNRLQRVTKALNAAAIPYAVIDGFAVQHWVARKRWKTPVLFTVTQPA
jgi:hypothetical protein